MSYQPVDSADSASKQPIPRTSLQSVSLDNVETSHTSNKNSYEEDDDDDLKPSLAYENMHKQAKMLSNTQSSKYSNSIDDHDNHDSDIGLDDFEQGHDHDHDQDDDDHQLLVGATEKQKPFFQQSKSSRCMIISIVTALLVTGIVLVGALFMHTNSASTSSTQFTNSSSTSSAASSSKPSLHSPPSANSSNDPGFGSPAVDPAKRLFLMQDWRSGSLHPTFESIEWVSPFPGNNSVVQLLEDTNEGYVLVDYPDRSKNITMLESSQRVFSYNQSLFIISSFTLSPDRKRGLITTNVKRNYRHSTFANYFIYNVQSKKIVPLKPDHGKDFISLAKWSPLGDKIAFIQDNNIFVRIFKDDANGDGSTDEIKQITQDGGTEIFYGRPDWVYEEEVFASDTAMWWSPKGDYLAYLRTNDSSVQEFPIPFFVQNTQPGKHPYPILKNIKYPKPGSANPIVDLLLLDANSYESFQVPVEENEKNDNEKLITEVVWTGDHHVIMRMSNREASLLKVGVIDAKARTGNISRVVDASKDGGWFEISQNTRFVPADSSKGRDQDGYIDMNVIEGYNHLVYYSPINATEPKAVLTKGEWEVDDDQVAFNPNTNKVYFISTRKSSVERHVYSVNLDGSDLKAITNETEDGWYSASFSPNSRFAIINYKGPKVPWQVVLDLEAEDVWKSAVKLAQNEKIQAMISNYHLPEQIYSQVEVGVDEKNNKILANAVEYRPPNFNESLKYPVLFYVYGGPVSQLVQKTFSFGFPQIVASSLNSIVVTVDGRGTGFRGRAYRNVIREHLGRYETKDQIGAAKHWASLKYVDPERIAIWGWSYGGFTTLKTLETDGGETFKYGMAVAPVTDWRFYDSIYAERYMRLPGDEHNAKGYEEAAITNVRQMAQNKRFLIMHGTGDDNVHFQNTLTLLDKLDIDGIENYDMHVFPDSDHSIYYHNANKVIYDKLLHWIGDAFSGKFLNFLKKRSEIP